MGVYVDLAVLNGNGYGLTPAVTSYVELDGNGPVLLLSNGELSVALHVIAELYVV